MSSIGRKAVFKKALYKRMEEQRFVEDSKRLIDYITLNEALREPLQSIITASRIYLDSGTYQRFQCIDKMWVPLCVLARRCMVAQGVAGSIGMDTLRFTAAILHDHFHEQLKTQQEGS